MKKTHKYNTQKSEIDMVMDAVSSHQLFNEKVRINVYIPKAIVKLMDFLGKDISRGELVTSLLIEKAKKLQKDPYGLFTGTEITEKEIDDITHIWDKHL